MKNRKASARQFELVEQPVGVIVKKPNDNLHPKDIGEKIQELLQKLAKAEFSLEEENKKHASEVKKMLPGMIDLTSSTP